MDPAAGVEEGTDERVDTPHRKPLLSCASVVCVLPIGGHWRGRFEVNDGADSAAVERLEQALLDFEGAHVDAGGKFPALVQPPEKRIQCPQANVAGHRAHPAVARGVNRLLEIGAAQRPRVGETVGRRTAERRPCGLIPLQRSRP